jgi:hypothetical protein
VKTKLDVISREFVRSEGWNGITKNYVMQCRLLTGAVTIGDVSYRREPYLKTMEHKVSSGQEGKYQFHILPSLL